MPGYDLPSSAKSRRNRCSRNCALVFGLVDFMAWLLGKFKRRIMPLPREGMARFPRLTGPGAIQSDVS